MSAVRNVGIGRHQIADWRRVIATPLVLALGLLASLALATPAAASEQDRGAEVLRLVNQERAVVGVAPLGWNASLAVAAQLHALDMAQHDFLSHTGSNGSSPRDRAMQAGYDSLMVGENIALARLSPTEVMNLWMGSEGHRRNILNPSYVHLGAAEFDNYWVQVFGSPGSATPHLNRLPVYRLSNSGTHMHLWTTDWNEFSGLHGTSGWIGEGLAWSSPTSGTAVNRLFHPTTARHLYTSDQTEIAHLVGTGWNNEGTVFFSVPGTGVPVYRLFNPAATGTTHLLSINANEITQLEGAGWTNEGVAFFAIP